MTNLFLAYFKILHFWKTKPHQSLPVTFPDHTHKCNIQLLEIKTSHKNADTYMSSLVPVRFAWSVGKVEYFILLFFITQYPKNIF